MITQDQAKDRQAILDDPETSEAVKRAMLHFWQKCEEYEGKCQYWDEDGCYCVCGSLCSCKTDNS